MTSTEPDADELARLQTEYGREWRIRRTPQLWIATALTPGVEPTIIVDTADALERRMRNPDRSVGGPLVSELE